MNCNFNHNLIIRSHRWLPKRDNPQISKFCESLIFKQSVGVIIIFIESAHSRQKSTKNLSPKNPKENNKNTSTISGIELSKSHFFLEKNVFFGSENHFFRLNLVQISANSQLVSKKYRDKDLWQFTTKTSNGSLRNKDKIFP